MTHAPSLRQIREAIEAQARNPSGDAVALESLRQDVLQMVESTRAAIERVRDFAARGLVSEAASVAEDFPDLARQADALMAFPRSSTGIARFWSQHIDVGEAPVSLPTSEDVDLVASAGDQASRLRPLLDALRAAALRREPIGSRLAILKKLRETDPRNRLWLDQIDLLEREWIKRIAEMRTEPGATREELEEAFTALSSRQWVAPVPRGLKDEIYARVKPMRAVDAVDRYAELAVKIHDAAALMDRHELERLEAQWAQVFHETGRMPSEAQNAAVSSAFEWLGRVAAEERTQAEFDLQVDRLERLLDGRAAAGDIERQLSVIRDGARSAPEGVVARAQAYLQSERDRTRRRHRLVLVASLAAAGVVLVGGVLAVWSYARNREQQQAAAALNALVEKGDALAAHSLAVEIMAKPELLSTEVKALLTRESELQTQWNAERTLVASESTEIEAVLGKGPDRAALKALATRLAAAQQRARLGPERAAFDALAVRIVARESELDALDKKATDDGLATVDQLLKDWPLPDRWTPAQSVDLRRWDDYLAQLERAKGSLERAKLDVAGSEVQESRIATRTDAVVARIEEARTRRQELGAALAALAPGKLGAGVSSEADFTQRLVDVLAKHGATLQRLGRLGAFEECQRFGPAWASIQSWRDEARPKVALALGKQGDPSANPEALAAIQDFLVRFPETPYRARAEELMRRIDPASRAPIWSAERARGVLSDHFYSELEEVPFVDNGRFFYRRSSTLDRDPFHRAVENLAELGVNPDRLNAYLPKLGEVVRGGARPSSVSQAWEALERSLATADVTEVQGLLLGTLEKLRTLEAGEILFRARALRDLAVVFKQSGHVPPAAQKPLDEWLDRCSRLWSAGLAADWLQAVYAAPTNIRTLRSEAASAISEFPSLVKFVEQARVERARAEEEIRPLAPIGVLLPAESAGDLRALGEDRRDGPVVLVVRQGAAFRLLDAELRNGRIDVGSTPIPAGPVLVFRRAGS